MTTQNEVIEIGEKEWEKIVERSDTPVFVMFYSPMCAFCKTMEPHFQNYAQEFNKQVIFARVNVFNTPSIVERYGIMSTPTFKFFCHGKPVHELVGEIYPYLLKKTVEEMLEHGEQCATKSSSIDYSISGYT